MPLGQRPLGSEPVGQEHAFDGVELSVAPRLQIVREIILQQPVVDEGPILLGPQAGQHDCLEKLRIFLEQEEVQLVAGML